LLLPEDVSIFGLDEHTACLIDLEKEEAVIKGIGSVTLRSRGAEMIFKKGERFSLEVLRGGEAAKEWKPIVPQPTPQELDSDTRGESFWDRVHTIEEAFRLGLEEHQPKESTNALLELDRTIWKAQQDFESEEFISQARDTLRELIVSLGVKLESSPRSKAECIGPLVEDLLELRQKLRRKKQYQAADAIRESLHRADVIVEDIKDGSRWRLK
jgi:cysteinyl-tRNA synthetase